ncbi:MAG: hypothetical protein RLZZ93_1322 [Actinomycetota bacterium]
MTIQLSYRAALSTAATSSSGEETLDTPTDDPMFAGFTNRSVVDSFHSTNRSFGEHSSWWSVVEPTWGIPAAAKRRFAMPLSIASALASTPLPTYGTPASSRSPCTVPSSPIGPCSNGTTTASGWRVTAAVGSTTGPDTSSGSGIVRGASPRQSWPGDILHAPSRSMPTATMS